MQEPDDLTKFEQQFDVLLRQHNNLQKEVRTLRAREADLLSERAKLMQKNELARARVEAMISRLKSMESGI